MMSVKRRLIQHYGRLFKMEAFCYLCAPETHASDGDVVPAVLILWSGSSVEYLPAGRQGATAIINQIICSLYTSYEVILLDDSMLG